MLERTTREDFLLPAFRAEVKDLLPGWGAVPYYNNIIWVEKNKEKILVGVCSDIYGFVSTSEIFPKLEELLAQKYEFEVVYKQQDYNKFYVDYVILNQDSYIGNNNDIIKPAIKIIHSYNGTLKYILLFGFYRKICSNGLYGFVKKTQFDYKHTSNNVEKIINDSLMGIEIFLEENEDLKRKYEVLEQKECFYPDRVEEILKLTKPLFPKKAIAAVNELLQEENKKGVITDWIIYNIFNQVLNTFQNKLYEEEIIKLDIKIFEYLYNN